MTAQLTGYEILGIDWGDVANSGKTALSVLAKKDGVLSSIDKKPSAAGTDAAALQMALVQQQQAQATRQAEESAARTRTAVIVVGGVTVVGVLGFVLWRILK